MLAAALEGYPPCRSSRDGIVGERTGHRSLWLGSRWPSKRLAPPPHVAECGWEIEDECREGDDGFLRE